MNLVTGANGHLGNNLIRTLLERGKNVRGSIRNLNNTIPFEGLDVELVYGELLDKDSLYKAMEGVDTLYHCAFVFKHWAKDPQKEIIDINLKGTKNILEAAAEQNVNKIIFVSSVVTLYSDSIPLDENCWNRNDKNPYHQAKIQSEKLAWNLTKKLNLPLLTILPGAMVGPNYFNHLTTTMKFLDAVVKNKQRTDPNFNFNIIGIKDVVNGMISAAEKGRIGQRYLLCSETSTTTSKILELAHFVYPELKIPRKVSKNTLNFIARVMAFSSKIKGKPPKFVRSQVNRYYNADLRANISKARKELDYNPKPAEEAIKETLIYLYNSNHKNE